jgi:hypothetical protein
MSTLKKRIANTGQTYPDLTVVGHYNTPTMRPTARISYTPTIGMYETVYTMWAPRGAPIMAYSGARGEVRKAGSLR